MLGDWIVGSIDWEGRLTADDHPLHLGRAEGLRCRDGCGVMSDSAKPLSEFLTDSIASHLHEVSKARERACEAAIQSGVCGVRETWTQGTAVGDTVSLGVVTFEVTTDVPYGCIHVRDERRKT